MKYVSNGGGMLSPKEGYFQKYGKVWLNEESLTNILPLSNQRKYCVTMSIGPPNTDPKMVGEYAYLKTKNYFFVSFPTVGTPLSTKLQNHPPTK